jgi:hypothetical protein
MSFLKKIDFSDIIILIGFGGISYGIAVKHGIPDMCLTSGSLLIFAGLFFARASGRGKK